jgi:hypothetical protein
MIEMDLGDINCNRIPATHTSFLNCIFLTEIKEKIAASDATTTVLVAKITSAVSVSKFC